MATDLRNVERSLESMTRTLSRIESSVRPAQPDESRPRSGTLIAQFPLELDWMIPSIKTKASFILNADGRLTVNFDITGEDVDIVRQLMSQMPVEALQLSVVNK